MDEMLPAAYRGLSEKDLRKEYTRLRRNAQRRKKTLENWGYEKTSAYKFAQSRLSFAPQSELSLRDLKYEIYDLEQFLTVERSTLAQARAATNKQIAALQQAGYSWIRTKDEFETFVEFMEYSRTLNSERIVGSAPVAEKFRDLQQEGKSPEIIREELLAWVTSEAKAQAQAQALSDIYRKSLGI